MWSNDDNNNNDSYENLFPSHEQASLSDIEASGDLFSELELALSRRSQHDDAPLTTSVASFTPNVTMDDSSNNFNQQQFLLSEIQRKESQQFTDILCFDCTTWPLSSEHHHHPTVEVSPGFVVRLRGYYETRQACQMAEQTTTVACVSCSSILTCIRDAEFVLCSECHFIGLVPSVRTNMINDNHYQVGGGLAVGLAPQQVFPDQVSGDQASGVPPAGVSTMASLASSANRRRPDESSRHHPSPSKPKQKKRKTNQSAATKPMGKTSCPNVGGTYRGLLDSYLKEKRQHLRQKRTHLQYGGGSPKWTDLLKM